MIIVPMCLFKATISTKDPNLLHMMHIFSPCFSVLDVIKSINELMKVLVQGFIHLTLNSWRGIGDPIWHDKKSRVSMVGSNFTFLHVWCLATHDYEFLHLQDQRICGENSSIYLTVDYSLLMLCLCLVNLCMILEKDTCI